MRARRACVYISIWWRGGLSSGSISQTESHTHQQQVSPHTIISPAAALAVAAPEEEVGAFADFSPSNLISRRRGSIRRKVGLFAPLLIKAVSRAAAFCQRAGNLRYETIGQFITRGGWASEQPRKISAIFPAEARLQNVDGRDLISSVGPAEIIKLTQVAAAASIYQQYLVPTPRQRNESSRTSCDAQTRTWYSTAFGNKRTLSMG